MLSKNQIKFLQSLSRKKGRIESGCFLAEGNKLVEDTLHAFACRMLVATTEWWAAHRDVRCSMRVEVTPDELSKVSQLTTPQDVLAVYEMPQRELDETILGDKLTLVLDTVQDPGNLGTIIRIADWMGIRHIVCSPETADVYNPKVVQATMGALARVAVYYMPLFSFLNRMKDILPIYGTYLDGENIYDTHLSDCGLIVMGNEGKGISPSLEGCISHRLLIPSFPPNAETGESLNVAVATAITCAEFRRRTMNNKK